jgi:hypothetical protein
MKIYVCPKKEAARRRTIIEPYRRHSGWWSMPADKQYWTLCADQTDSRGRLLRGGEVDQIKQAGLLNSLGQVYGVDTVKTIIADNKRGIPGAHWYCGDLYEVIASHIQQGTFNPGIVNYDSKVMPVNGCPYLANLMVLLSGYMDVLFVCNLVFHARHRFVDQNDAWRTLLDQPQFRAAFTQGWNFDYSAYVYAGTGKTHTTMGSFVFWR